MRLTEDSPGKITTEYSSEILCESCIAKNIFSEITIGEQLQTIEELIKGTGEVIQCTMLQNLEKLDYYLNNLLNLGKLQSL